MSKELPVDILSDITVHMKSKFSEGNIQTLNRDWFVPSIPKCNPCQYFHIPDSQSSLKAIVKW